MSNFPDYEAALQEYKIGGVDAVQRIVDAALGGMRLWITVESADDCSYCDMTWSWCDLNGTCCHECPHYTNVRVWPKGG